MSTLHEMAAAFHQARTAPDARRKAYPSAVCCVDCQGIRERRA